MHRSEPLHPTGYDLPLEAPHHLLKIGPGGSGRCASGAIWVCLLLGMVACGSGENAPGATTGATSRPGSPSAGAPPASGPAPSTAVPIETAPVTRRTISQHLETNGVLEAENEVDIVARVSGPIVALEVEEGMEIAHGKLLARIDDREYANQVAIATVSRDDARRAFERTKASRNEGLVSQEAYDSALSRLESAEAQLEARQIQLDYTRIVAPFSGKLAARYVKLAQHVGVNTPLFRITDFNPLLCPIQVPEKDLSLLGVGQPAYLHVEAFPGEQFGARVQRIRPTIEATSGTITVTLEVESRGMLRPGMFASVYLKTETHANALVIPASALVLDSIGDTVFVRSGEVAVRREVRLGFRDGESVEVLEGLADTDQVIVLGQDGLADGTPVTVLSESPGAMVAQAQPSAAPGPTALTPEMVEQIRQRMKERGLSDQEIEERLQRMREGGGQPLGPPPGGGGQQPGAGPEGGLPPQLVEYIRNANPEQLEQIRQRMRERGRTEEEIKEILKQIRGCE